MTCILHATCCCLIAYAICYCRVRSRATCFARVWCCYSLEDVALYWALSHGRVCVVSFVALCAALVLYYHGKPSATLTSGLSLTLSEPTHKVSHSIAAALSPELLSTLPHKIDHNTTAASHELCSWFGVSTFVLLSVNAPYDAQCSKSDATLYLSALSLAANYAQCSIPLFVPVGERSKKQYHGRTGFGSVVRFDCRHVADIPTTMKHLAGVTDHFHDTLKRLEKLNSVTQTTIIPNLTTASAVALSRLNVTAATTAANPAASRTLISASFNYVIETSSWKYSDISLSPLPAYSCNWRRLEDDVQIGFGSFWGPTVSAALCRTFAAGVILLAKQPAYCVFLLLVLVCYLPRTIHYTLCNCQPAGHFFQPAHLWTMQCTAILTR